MLTVYVWRSVYPHTDCGHTWIESLIVEHDDCRITIPSAGYTDRFIDPPGGPIHCDINAEIAWYEKESGEKARWLPRKETVHDDGFYHIGRVVIDEVSQ